MNPEALDAVAARVMGGTAAKQEPEGHNLTPRGLHVGC